MNVNPAPLHESIMHSAPVGGSACWLKTDDGKRIRFAWWRNQPSGTVLFLNGRTEYIEKHGFAVAELLRRGFSVATMDWRGQGLSDSIEHPAKPTHVQDFAEFQMDLDAAVSAISELDLPTPLYLFSHSMGGAIGIRALLEGLNVNAAAFCAPMLGIHLSLPTRLLLRTASAIAFRFGWPDRPIPDLAFGNRQRLFDRDLELLTSDSSMLSWCYSQMEKFPEIRRHMPTFGWARAALAECRSLAAQRPPQIPAIAFIGTEECVVEPSAVHSYFADWQTTNIEILREARHELLVEKEEVRLGVVDRVAAFFDRYP